MTVAEFLSVKGKHSVAMEYYWVILNRTFLTFLTNDSLIGLKVGGPVSVEGGRDPLTRAITGTMAVKGDLNNPYSYIKTSYAAKYENVDFNAESMRAMDNSNFAIAYKDIAGVHFNPNKKWGMGPYPHDGRVLVTHKDGSKREFIILGTKSGESVCNSIAQLANC
ncbi:hypothetical protein [Hymenobacter coccineus]|uniref:hypothetical protein n=1 Tax=Hymenobacter coccineus TaxID=1908235 RepID=UPI000F7723C0|nr:hypothetical protein [Hymenobacter coccineus]